MDYYLLLRLSHIAGFILLGDGLLAVFISELRAHTTDDVHVFAETAWYTAIFYDALVLPGALLVGLSGLSLTFEPGFPVCRLPNADHVSVSRMRQASDGLDPPVRLPTAAI